MPFFEALRGSKPFKWTEEQQVAFDELKKYLVTLTTLKPPPQNVPLFLYLAVALNAVSAVLVYEVLEDGKLKQYLVYYVSETLSSARCNYIIVEKMILGVVMASRKLKQYFDDHEITIPTIYPIRDVGSGTGSV